MFLFILSLNPYFAVIFEPLLLRSTLRMHAKKSRRNLNCFLRCVNLKSEEGNLKWTRKIYLTSFFTWDQASKSITWKKLEQQYFQFHEDLHTTSTTLICIQNVSHQHLCSISIIDESIWWRNLLHFVRARLTPWLAICIDDVRLKFYLDTPFLLEMTKLSSPVGEDQMSEVANLQVKGHIYLLEGFHPGISSCIWKCGNVRHLVERWSHRRIIWTYLVHSNPLFNNVKRSLP